MTYELQSTIEASAMEWPAWRNHILFMAHVRQLAVGALFSSVSVKDRTKCWEAHEQNTQFGVNESTDNGNGQRLTKAANACINKVSTKCTGLPNIIQKVHISRYFESSETNVHIAENICCNEYTDTWSSK